LAGSLVVAGEVLKVMKKRGNCARVMAPGRSEHCVALALPAELFVALAF
jgi:hypothetical protein